MFSKLENRNFSNFCRLHFSCCETASAIDDSGGHGGPNGWGPEPLTRPCHVPLLPSPILQYFRGWYYRCLVRSRLQSQSRKKRRPHDNNDSILRFLLVVLHILSLLLNWIITPPEAYGELIDHKIWPVQKNYYSFLYIFYRISRQFHFILK